MIQQPIKIREDPLYHFVCFFNNIYKHTMIQQPIKMIQLVMLMVVCAKDN